MASTIQDKLMQSIPRAVVHLRAQKNGNRLGLIFGAGIGVDLGYPNWDELVQRISDHKEVGAAKVWNKLRSEGAGGRAVTRSLASVTQMLFSEFRKRKIKERRITRSLTFVQEQRIKTDWLRLIHSQLYERLLDRSVRVEKLKSHPYLEAFRRIIKKSPLTVTYNFDDSLELMLAEARSEDEEDTERGFERIDSPDAQFKRDQGVIYHPNGCITAIFSDGTSRDVVFADASFQDQLLSAATGKFVHLSNHLFRNTCLLIGLSLEDSTLQSLLRQNAVQNPGNVHYAVHFLKDDCELDAEAQSAIFTANFESFGIITLFLRNAEIKALAGLIEMSAQTFERDFGKYDPKFVYYLIGSVGAGKSTAAGNFRNLINYDEWIDERDPNLAKPEAEVDDDEAIERMNAYITEQFRKKNFALHSCAEGIHLVDRAPLDPLTFQTPEKRAARAATLLAEVTDRNSRTIVKGHIIQLTAPVADLKIRNSLKHKYWPSKEFERLIGAIDEVYGSIDRSIVCTSGRSAAAVAKELARIIFLDPYQPVDLQNELAIQARGAAHE
ncbi:SIR2 family protein [Sphingosinicella sp. LY1275]|uniref:SIR2 family protein n=1 Tax=Sphingosinicella sp. LY1275 TaxID=3095379 RepID=UPI002ADED40B|nr:SIR2 family protein [Sphingosinicella sp. LY1275]MEA1015389.1 SIR2 family protein [Sphingosinicella sp. LY1275]